MRTVEQHRSTCKYQGRNRLETSGGVNGVLILCNKGKEREVHKQIYIHVLHVDSSEVKASFREGFKAW